MKLWPFGRDETRADSYTDTLDRPALVSRASGKTLAIPSRRLEHWRPARDSSGVRSLRRRCPLGAL